MGTKSNLVFTFLDVKLFLTNNQKYKVNFNRLNKCIILHNEAKKLQAHSVTP